MDQNKVIFSRDQSNEIKVITKNYLIVDRTVVYETEKKTAFKYALEDAILERSIVFGH